VLSTSSFITVQLKNSQLVPMHNFTPFDHTSNATKVVIGNIHNSKILTDISDAMAKHGHFATRAVNIKKSNRPLSLFHVELVLNEINQEIFKINILIHSAVIVEKLLTKRNNPSQCYTYQTYGHTRNYFSRKSRFVKCGEDCSIPIRCAL
jgi:hypothetical protein